MAQLEKTTFYMKSGQLFIYLLISLTCIGITYFSGDFAKIKIGPLYILEALFIFWFFYNLKDWRWFIRFIFHDILPFAIFMTYGSVLAVVDFITSRNIILEDLTILRFLQHTVIFVYPLLWIPLGFWMISKSKALSRICMWGILLAALYASYFEKRVANYSLGPILLFPALYFSSQLFSEIGRKRISIWILSIVFSISTFIPFWWMWKAGQFQRTSIMLLFIGLMILLFFNYREKALKLIMLEGAIFLIGFLATSHFGHVNLSSAALIKSVQHENLTYALPNIPLPPASPIEKIVTALPPQSSFRAFWWRIAILDWLSQPVLGLRFIPEVPSYVEQFPLRQNGWNQRNPGAPPISGPHNSYLTILARMGCIGIGLFLWALISWFFQIRVLFRNMKDLLTSTCLLISLNGLGYATLNVGFESPPNCFLLWIFFGSTLALAKENAQSFGGLSKC